MPPTILYVEDNRLLMQTVKETFELEGWSVDDCHDGITALAKIRSAEPYDLLLIDNDLPGVKGLELTRQARLLSHREATPIVIISASELEDESRLAGADGFLKKPDDIPAMIGIISRLLERGRAT